jgi:DNA repair protein RecO (recombination protein O)
MLRFDSQPAYILHARPYQETSLLLDIFTRDFGRLSAIAKGAKRPKSRGRGLLQPFVPLVMSCAGKGELLTVKDFDAVAAPIFLKGQRLVFAFYLNELLIRLLHRADAHHELFQVYTNCLHKLKDCLDEELAQEPLRLFEKSLLKELGYELHLSHEVDTLQPLDPEEHYLFDPETGPALIQDLEMLGHKAVFKGSSLLAIAKELLTEKSVLQDARRLMRLALSSHLGNRPLESRRLLSF